MCNILKYPFTNCKLYDIITSLCCEKYIGFSRVEKTREIFLENLKKTIDKALYLCYTVDTENNNDYHYQYMKAKVKDGNSI